MLRIAFITTRTFSVRNFQNWPSTYEKLRFVYNNSFPVICVLQITYPLFPDLGYQSVDAYKTLVVTVWIPFVDSNEQNGCMQVH